MVESSQTYSKAEIETSKSDTLALIKKINQVIVEAEALRSSISTQKIPERKLTMDDAHAEFKGNIEVYVCQICKHIVSDMVSCAECESLFCKDCIESCTRNKPECPECNSNFVEGKLNKRLINMLNRT